MDGNSPFAIFGDSAALPTQQICTQADLAAGIRTALDRHAKIINISASQQTDQLALSNELSNALQAAADADVLVVAAAGNQGCACDTIPASVAGVQAPLEPVEFHYAEDNPTALVVPLPQEVKPGESVTLELEYVMRLPPKKGRWGQWDGITTLAQWPLENRGLARGMASCPAGLIAEDLAENSPYRQRR